MAPLRLQKLVASAMEVVVAVVVLVALSGVNTAEAACKKNFVYPYLSPCSSPIKYGSDKWQMTGYEVFRGGLVTEYDESNKTYYMRFTGSILNQGDSFNFLPENLDASQIGNSVELNTGAVFISNTNAASDSYKYLGWREEGDNEWFLTAAGIDNAATFRFVKAPTSIILLPCTPSILLDIVCQAYYVLSKPPGASSEASAAGFLAYVENGVTYIKLAQPGENGNLAIVLKTPIILDPATGSRRAASSSSFSTHMLMPTQES